MNLFDDQAKEIKKLNLITLFHLIRDAARDIFGRVLTHFDIRNLT